MEPIDAWAARDLAVAGGVEYGVDSLGGDRPNPVGEALAVDDGDHPERAQPFVVVLARGADHARATGHGELGGERAHATGGGMDQQGLALGDLEAFEDRPRGSARTGESSGDVPGDGGRLADQCGGVGDCSLGVGRGA